MPSVTRDRKKYGAPTVYSEERRRKREQRDRENELLQQIEQDIEAGRRDGWNGRVNPIFED